MQVGLDRLWYFRSFDPNLGGEQDCSFFVTEKRRECLRIHANRAVWNPEHGWTFYHRISWVLFGKWITHFKPGNQILWEYSGSSNDEKLISGSASRY